MPTRPHADALLEVKEKYAAFALACFFPLQRILEVRKAHPHQQDLLWKFFIAWEKHVEDKIDANPHSMTLER